MMSGVSPHKREMILPKLLYDFSIDLMALMVFHLSTHILIFYLLHSPDHKGSKLRIEYDSDARIMSGNIYIFFYTVQRSIP